MSRSSPAIIGYDTHQMVTNIWNTKHCVRMPELYDVKNYLNAVNTLTRRSNTRAPLQLITTDHCRGQTAGKPRHSKHLHAYFAMPIAPIVVSRF